jgi:CRP-like cAMP-binding protein
MQTLSSTVFEKLRTHVLSSEDMSEEVFNLIKTLMIPKKLRKRQYLLQAGDVCAWIAFISRGCLRHYSLDDLGKEYIVRFAVEGSWMTDMESFRTHTPATRNIDALEDSELLLIDTISLGKLTASAPQWDHYVQGAFQKALSDSLERISEFVGTSAEKRYLRFMSMYPDLLQRIPLHQIASYLGITPQSLSRIRKELAKRK